MRVLFLVFIFLTCCGPEVTLPQDEKAKTAVLDKNTDNDDLLGVAWVLYKENKLSDSKIVIEILYDRGGVDTYPWQSLEGKDVSTKEGFVSFVFDDFKKMTLRI